MTNPLPTRLRRCRFNEYETVYTGSDARSIRTEVKREQEAALAYGDATGDYSRFRDLSDTQAEIGRRLAARIAA